MPARIAKGQEGCVSEGKGSREGAKRHVRRLRTDYEGGIRREIGRRRPGLIREPRVITATIAAPSE